MLSWLVWVVLSFMFIYVCVVAVCVRIVCVWFIVLFVFGVGRRCFWLGLVVAGGAAGGRGPALMSLRQPRWVM